MGSNKIKGAKMKLTIILLIVLCMGGCNARKDFEFLNESTKIDVSTYEEGYGYWVIIQDIPTEYYYIVRFNRNDFMKLWTEGMTLELLPQKYSDSKGEGKKILEEEHEVELMDNAGSGEFIVVPSE